MRRCPRCRNDQVTEVHESVYIGSPLGMTEFEKRIRVRCGNCGFNGRVV